MRVSGFKRTFTAGVLAGAFLLAAAPVSAQTGSAPIVAQTGLTEMRDQIRELGKEAQDMEKTAETGGESAGFPYTDENLDQIAKFAQSDPSLAAEAIDAVALGFEDVKLQHINPYAVSTIQNIAQADPAMAEKARIALEKPFRAAHEAVLQNEKEKLRRAAVIIEVAIAARTPAFQDIATGDMEQVLQQWAPRFDPEDEAMLTAVLQDYMAPAGRENAAIARRYEPVMQNFIASERAKYIEARAAAESANEMAWPKLRLKLAADSYSHMATAHQDMAATAFKLFSAMLAEEQAQPKQNAVKPDYTKPDYIRDDGYAGVAINAMAEIALDHREYAVPLLDMLVSHVKNSKRAAYGDVISAVAALAVQYTELGQRGADMLQDMAEKNLYSENGQVAGMIFAVNSIDRKARLNNLPGFCESLAAQLRWGPGDTIVPAIDATENEACAHTVLGALKTLADADASVLHNPDVIVALGNMGMRFPAQKKAALEILQTASQNAGRAWPGKQNPIRSACDWEIRRLRCEGAPPQNPALCPR